MTIQRDIKKQRKEEQIKLIGRRAMRTKIYIVDEDGYVAIMKARNEKLGKKWVDSLEEQNRTYFNQKYGRKNRKAEIAPFQYCLTEEEVEKALKEANVQYEEDTNEYIFI